MHILKKGNNKQQKKLSVGHVWRKKISSKKDFIWRSRGIRKEKGIILLKACTSFRLGKEN